jgi:hypothetical protein
MAARAKSRKSIRTKILDSLAQLVHQAGFAA